MTSSAVARLRYRLSRESRTNFSDYKIVSYKAQK